MGIHFLSATQIVAVCRLAICQHTSRLISLRVGVKLRLEYRLISVLDLDILKSKGKKFHDYKN